MAGWCGGPTARHPSCPHCLRACCASRRAKRQRLERSAGPNPGGPDKSLKLLGRGARSAYAFAVSAISGIPPAPAEKSMKSNRSKQRERRFGSLFPLFPSVHSFDPQRILSPCIVVAGSDTVGPCTGSMACCRTITALRVLSSYAKFLPAWPPRAIFTFANPRAGGGG